MHVDSPNTATNDAGMRIGISVPNMGPLTGKDIALAIAEYADRYAFSSLWIGDHIVFPDEIASIYPHPGGFSSRSDQAVLEPLVMLGYLGGLTTRVRLGISVLVVPYRNPVTVAKMIATLDILTDGRVDLGIGTGWMAEEFRILRADYERRGSVTDEYLAIYKNLLTQEVASFTGTHYSYEGVRLLPKPVQKPYPPIWVGGVGPRVRRRAARLGDAYQPLSLTPDELRVEYAKLAEDLEESGRDPATFVRSARVFYTVDDPSPMAPGVCAIYGDATTVRDAMRRYEEAGVDELLMSPRGPTKQRTIEYVRRLGEEVLPQFV